MNARQRRTRERALFRYMMTYSSYICLGCRRVNSVLVDEDGLCAGCGADVIVVTGPTGAAAVGPLLDALNADRTIHAIVTSMPGLEHVTVAGDFDLLRRLVANIGGQDDPRPRWSFVKARLGHGSGVSRAICRALDLDPEELVGRQACGCGHDEEGEPCGCPAEETRS